MGTSVFTGKSVSSVTDGVGGGGEEVGGCGEEVGGCEAGDEGCEDDMSSGEAGGIGEDVGGCEGCGEELDGCDRPPPPDTTCLASVGRGWSL